MFSIEDFKEVLSNLRQFRDEIAVDGKNLYCNVSVYSKFQKALIDYDNKIKEYTHCNLFEFASFTNYVLSGTKVIVDNIVPDSIMYACTEREFEIYRSVLIDLYLQKPYTEEEILNMTVCLYALEQKELKSRLR